MWEEWAADLIRRGRFVGFLSRDDLDKLYPPPITGSPPEPHPVAPLMPRP